jgi:rare lipoprotein A
MRRLTAAHRSLPLGTYLQVMNLENGRVVRVRVNDRGPYVDGRVLDLSLEAARALDMVERGVVPVRFDVIAAP